MRIQYKTILSLWLIGLAGLSAIIGCAAKSNTASTAAEAVDGAATNTSAGSLVSYAAAGVPEYEIQPGEELWVIVEPTSRNQTDDTIPGGGSLLALLPGEKEQVPVPLKHTDVQGDIQGYIATVDVTQQFHNPFASKIEAVYVFPLPQNAAVNDFVMTVGERKIRGVIREREQAERIYTAARNQGYVASLLTQERPNIFTQKVANIEPGKQIDINMKYFQTLAYDDGWYEFVFPMVVGPRFNPPCTTNGIGVAARGQHGTSGQSTEVQYLSSHKRSGHDISLALTLDTGVEIQEIQSVNHQIERTRTEGQQVRIRLSDTKTVPNEDFVLRYRVAGQQVRTALMTHEDEQGKFFTLVAYPPFELEHQARNPMEMIFVLDCSGSMSGKPLAQVKAAVCSALDNLRPNDSFQIIRFSSRASKLGRQPLLATPQNVRRGKKYVNSLAGSGGTQMIKGMTAALDFDHDPSRTRVVSFMTDGFIGNEAQVLQTIHQNLGDSRIFSFGVGQSPNRYLMDRMALMGRGAVAYLSLNNNATEVMDHFAQRISHAAMSDLSIDWGDADVQDAYPQRLPDLIVGRQLVVTGRYKGELTDVQIRGRVNGQEVALPVPIQEVAKHSAIPSVWARMKIAELMNRSVYESNPMLKDSITQVALNHSLLSSYTAMIAVDSLTKTASEFGTTVATPVPMPVGVRYETTVNEVAN